MKPLVMSPITALVIWHHTKEHALVNFLSYNEYQGVTAWSVGESPRGQLSI
jgi:hypothetical protein